MIYKKLAKCQRDKAFTEWRFDGLNWSCQKCGDVSMEVEDDGNEGE